MSIFGICENWCSSKFDAVLRFNMCRLARLLINNMSRIIISAHIQNWHAIFYNMVEVNNMVEKKEFHFQTHNGTFDNLFFSFTINFD